MQCFLGFATSPLSVTQVFTVTMLGQTKTVLISIKRTPEQKLTSLKPKISKTKKFRKKLVGTTKFSILIRQQKKSNATLKHTEFHNSEDFAIN